MAGWTVYANLAEAAAALERLEQSMAGSGLERAAAFTARTLGDESQQAFAQAREPRTGATWDPRVRGSEPLLGGPGGSIARAVRTGYRHGPSAARVFANLDAAGEVGRYGLVHLYGVKARARRSNRRTRRRPGFVLPARRYIGLSRSAVKAILDKCRDEFGGGMAE